LALTLNKLTTREVETITKVGRHGDGGNLWLVVGPTGSKSWSFIFRWRGKTKEAGLGPISKKTLAAARQTAKQGRELLGEKPPRNPIEVWRAEKHTSERPTFTEAVETYFEAHKTDWRSDRGAAGWRRSLAMYTQPLSRLKVDEIGVPDVLACLKPIWREHPVTASRVRGRIESVLDAQIALGVEGPNPARWKGNLKHLLAKLPAVTNFTALPYEQVPAFVARLRERRISSDGTIDVGAYAFEYMILTAARTNEAIGAQWDEVDLDALAPTWTVPAWRTKRNREHLVPLSPGAVAVLRAMEKLKGASFVIPGRGGKPDRVMAPYVFPGRGEHRPLNHMIFISMLRQMKATVVTKERGERPVTAHGFRSCFADYLGNETATGSDVIEAALAHLIRDRTARAYRRGDAPAKRRKAMLAWDRYIGQTGNIIALRA